MPDRRVTAPTSSEQPVRVYLDQNFFSQLADGVRSGDKESPELIAYGRLKELVDASTVTIHFSFVHVVEGLRFGNVQSPRAVSYCHVVDTLTRGKCIRFPEYLRRAELELALADLFGFPSQYSRDEYPYGTYADGVMTDGLQIDYATFGLSIDSVMAKLEGLRKTLKTELPNRHAIRSFLRTRAAAAGRELGSILPVGMTIKTFLELLLSGSEEQRRSLAASVFTNPNFIRCMLQSLPDASFDEMIRQFPATNFSWTKEAAITALTGSLEEKESVLRCFFEGIMTFSHLVTHYSLTMPDLAGMGILFDTSASSIVDQLALMQRLEPLRAAILGTAATWDREIAKDVGVKFVAQSGDDIRAYGLKHGFSPEFAERKLSADWFKALPYISAVSIWTHSYLARHKGIKVPRRPEVNDLRDLLHCVNAPYVDILATDGFAGEVTRRLGERFGTRIVTSLADLISALP